MARYDPKWREEELKLKVAVDWFAALDTTRIIGNVDFCVAIPATELGLFEAENALWAEAKAGVRKDIHESFVQLILTIGRARTFDYERPRTFLGAFDAEKIAFLPFAAVQDVFAGLLVDGLVEIGSKGIPMLPAEERWQFYTNFVERAGLEEGRRSEIRAAISR